MKIVTIVELPHDLIQSWLQHVRDFDIAHPSKCEFSAIAHAPDMSVKELNDMINTSPPFAIRKILEE
jgi:hypothetical protein